MNRMVRIAEVETKNDRKARTSKIFPLGLDIVDGSVDVLRLDGKKEAQKGGSHQQAIDC